MFTSFEIPCLLPPPPPSSLAAPTFSTDNSGLRCIQAIARFAMRCRSEARILGVTHIVAIVEHPPTFLERLTTCSKQTCCAGSKRRRRLSRAHSSQPECNGRVRLRACVCAQDALEPHRRLPQLDGTEPSTRRFARNQDRCMRRDRLVIHVPPMMRGLTIYHK
jgi:hypothetical protein